MEAQQAPVAYVYRSGKSDAAAGCDIPNLLGPSAFRVLSYRPGELVQNARKGVNEEGVAVV